MRGTFLVLKKELIEFVKDRKTMLFMVSPLLLYPVLFGMMNTLGNRDEAQRKGNPSRIVLVDPGRVLAATLERDPQTFKLVDEPVQLSKAIADDHVDLKVTVGADAASRLKEAKPFELTVNYDRETRSSRLALERFEKLMAEARTRWVADRFAALGKAPDSARPYIMATKDVGDVFQNLNKMLGMMLPYILLLSMFAGAMANGAYMSAGERERGTLLSLLATRLSRRDIILGKQLALFILSIVQAVIQVVGMGLGTGRLALQEARESAALAGQSTSLGAIADPKVLLLTLLLLVPLGLLFTAIVMLVGIQSRNTREATTALTPGIFVMIFMGVFTMAPGVEKMAALPWVPVLNALVAIRKLFVQQLPAMEYVVALGMTILLAAAMTALATRILNRESALFKA